MENNHKYLPYRYLYLSMIFIYISLDSRYSVPLSEIWRWSLPIIFIVIMIIKNGSVNYPSGALWPLLIIIFFLSSLYSINILYSIERAISFLLIILMFYLYFTFLSHDYELENAIWYLGILFIGYEILNILFISSSTGRATGITGNSNSLGLWSNIAFVFAFYYIKDTKSKWKKIFLALVMVGSVYAAIVAGSRTYTICLLLNFAIVYFNIFKGNVKYMVLTITVFLGIFFWNQILSFINELPGIQRFYELGTSREDIWAAGLSLFRRRPLVGWGYGVNQQLNTIKYLGYIKGYGDYGFAFHNSYLSVLIETGIVGLSIVVIHFIIVLYNGVKALWKTPNGTLKCVLLIIVNMLICFYGGSSMTSVGSTEGFFFWGLLMWVYVYYSSGYYKKI